MPSPTANISSQTTNSATSTNFQAKKTVKKSIIARFRCSLPICEFPSSWTWFMFVKRNKNVEILPRKHSRTLVQVESMHFYRFQWWDRDSVVSNINVAKGEKKGPSTILWYSALDSKICVKVYICLNTYSRRSAAGAARKDLPGFLLPTVMWCWV